MFNMCTMDCLVFFFFKRSGDPRYLHSFPTRRSSDLGSTWLYASLVPLGMMLGPCRAFSSPPDTPVPRNRRPRPFVSRHRRSEEHTSELQSPCNLVCRLLLEKKKNRHSLHVTSVSHIA